MQNIKKIKLSIIVPVYNVELYLEKCVNSILKQTFKDFELILVDDGSSDSSSQICEAYKSDERVIVIHKSNGGLSDARNIGIRYSKGEYLSFIDSDDWIDEDMFSEMLQAASKTDSDIVVCGHRVVTVSGKIEETIVFKNDVVLSRTNATKLILKDEDIPSFAWNKIYRKDLFDFILFPKGRIYEDTATIYKCFNLANRVAIINRVFYNYLRRPGSICLDVNGNVEKTFKRMSDNALAFYERYMFAKSCGEYNEVVPICSAKAFIHIRSALHFAFKNKFEYKDKTVQTLLCYLKTVESVDKEIVSRMQSVELQLAASCSLIYYWAIKLYYFFKK